MESEELAKGAAAVLAAPVAVEVKAFLRAEVTGAKGFQEGDADEAGPEVIGEGPANHTAGADADDDGKMERARLGGNVSNVAGPNLVELGR